MAQNYNLGSTFGLNVSAQGSKLVGGSKVSAMGDLFDSISNSASRYEDVFNGNVEREIGMYSRQAMIVGMNLRASDGNIRKFDMNI